MSSSKFDPVFTKNLKIPVKNQKRHPELLREHVQDTEEKEQFLTKINVFFTRNEVSLHLN